MTLRRTALVLTAALTLTLGACGSPGPGAGGPERAAPQASTSPDSMSPGTDSPATTNDLLAAHGLAGLDARAVIEKLDATAVDRRPGDLMASVRPDALLISPRTAGGAAAEPTALPIEGDNGFYLSVAPYLSQTHECHFHSLTTCLGELRNQPVYLKVTGADGAVLAEKRTTTYDNGFVAVWLPRGISATLTVTHDGKTATQPISTGPQDATCITTTRLT